jgi:glucokinase
VEAIASRTAIVEALRAGVASGRPSLLAPLLTGEAIRLKKLRSGAISSAYRRRDPLTVEVLAEAQRALGVLTGSLVNLLDPEAVVFGGGLVEALGPRFLVPVRRVAREHFLLADRQRTVRIAMARLGDDAVALGAAIAAVAAAEEDAPPVRSRARQA